MTTSKSVEKVEMAEQKVLRQLRLALSAADFGDWSWNPHTDLITLSARAAEMFGVAPKTKTTWPQIVKRLHREDRKKARLALKQAIQSGQKYEAEYRVINANGDERWIAAKG